MSHETLEREKTMDFPAHPTDSGNAQLLVRAYGASLRYCHTWKKWLHYNGVKWVVDESGLIQRRARETVRLMYVAAAGFDGTAAMIDNAAARHALRSESARALAAMVSLARSEPGIPVCPQDFDCDIWKMAVQNGTLDLKTGELKPHDKLDLMTKASTVPYNAAAKAPAWEEFLNTVLDGNQELIAFLQRAVGYSLTGDTGERCLFVLHGHGANGKSTFLNAIQSVVVDYGLQTPTETLLSRGGGIQNDVARLRGARFVTSTECNEGARLAESTIKALTGNDIVVARFLYGEFFEFRPECKIWLGTNYKPVIRGTDRAIWDRIRLVPFNVTIAEDKQDRNLAAKLESELPGILAWAVRGCLDWQNGGLKPPAVVLEATTSYRNEMDTFSAFLEERCTLNASHVVAARHLGDSYIRWCETNGERPISKKAIGQALAARGFDSFKGQGGRREWMGLSLIGENIFEENSDEY